MQGLLAQLKGANIAAILVHHAGKGKNPETYRGSSNIATTFERVLGLIHDDKESPTKLAVTVKLDKYRDKPPEGFQPEFPLELGEEMTPNGPRPVWKLGDLHELREGWRMFAYGEYRNNGEFLKAFNKKFGTTYTKGNFAMQFTQRWQLKLGIAESEIRRAKNRMTERRNGNLETDTGDDF